jgi:hypothetical protein
MVHELARAVQAALGLVFDILPCGSAKLVMGPSAIHTPKVCVPAHTGPVKLEPLSVKFSRGIFKSNSDDTPEHGRGGQSRQIELDSANQDGHKNHAAARDGNSPG